MATGGSGEPPLAAGRRVVAVAVAVAAAGVPRGVGIGEACGMTVAVIDLLDRDGQVRQSVAVPAWPLSIGRALDNGLVLTDPHVAPHHLVLEAAPAGALAVVGATHNGVRSGTIWVRSGGRLPLPAGGPGPTELTVGRTRLRVHQASDELAPELALGHSRSLTRRAAPLLAAAAVLLAAQLLGTYLATDPDDFGRAVGATLMTASSGAVVWCGAWALLSKTFTRQAHLAWHLRVFLFGSLALLLLGAVPPALAFAFSWPAATDFSFVGSFIVGGIAVYFHLLAVEPQKKRLLRWVVAGGALAGIGVTLWLNVTRTDLWGEELYMSHLFPPAMRLARPVGVDPFVDGLSRLKPVLDRKSREVDGADAGATTSDADEGG